MILDITVTIQNKTTSFDSEGMSVDVWTASQTVERSHREPWLHDIEPKQFGVSDSDLVDIFFLKSTSAAQQNGRLVYGSETFTIYRLGKFKRHWEALCRPVVGE